MFKFKFCHNGAVFEVSSDAFDASFWPLWRLLVAGIKHSFQKVPDGCGAWNFAGTSTRISAGVRTHRTSGFPANFGKYILTIRRNYFLYK